MKKNGLTVSGKPFTVNNIGTFWPLIDTEDTKAFYVNFLKIPPHYHEGTVEEFIVKEGKGEFLYGPYIHDPVHIAFSRIVGREIEKKTEWERREFARRFPVYPGAKLIIPPYTPHELVVDPSYSYVGTFLICRPPLDTKDEIGLKVKDKNDSSQKI